MQERRRSPRQHIPLLVQYTCRDMNEFMSEYAVNLSVHGVFIRTTQPAPIGAQIYFQFYVDSGQRVLEGLGRVVHHAQDNTEIKGMGVEFIKLDESAQKSLAEILNKKHTS